MHHKRFPIQLEHCGTSYASKVLGLSIGSVQTLVEKKELDAWKTKGGHRRITLASLHDYQIRNHLASNLRTPNQHELLRLVIIDDDEYTLSMMRKTIERWNMEVDVHTYKSAVHALLDLYSWRPQLIITDLRMPLMNGFEFLKSLSKHQLYRNTTAIAMTGLSLDEVRAQGGLPDGVQYMQKPIDFDWLRGFVDALVIMRNIN